MITRNEVNNVVRNKADYWAAMVRNSYYMPHAKQSICTIKWFEEIRNQISWCPKQSDLPRNF